MILAFPKTTLKDQRHTNHSSKLDNRKKLISKNLRLLQENTRRLYKEDTESNIIKIIELNWYRWEKALNLKEIDSLNQIMKELKEQHTDHPLIGKIFHFAMDENDKNSKPEDLCAVCMEHSVSMIMVPCMHMVLCKTCGKIPYRECVVCRSPVEKISSVYR